MRGFKEETESPFCRKSDHPGNIKEWERCEVGEKVEGRGRVMTGILRGPHVPHCPC